ncbi:MAG: prepilin-type N-terminal cleavage/methylation domain-containing protein [Phycisphaerales bacterium]|nr:prepilin-type N-terminal cleavage/methylation domain-containing protein [Phycisphaerales bacterium]
MRRHIRARAAPGPPPGRGNWPRSAFTLVEILVAIGIVAALVVLATPALISSSGERRLRAAADQVSAALADARARAMRDDRAYAVVAAPSADGRRLVLRALDARSAEADHAGRELLVLGDEFSLTAGAATDESATGAPDGARRSSDSAAVPILTFLPDGTAIGPPSLDLTDSRSRRATLALNRLTGRLTPAGSPPREQKPPPAAAATKPPRSPRRARHRRDRGRGALLLELLIAMAIFISAGLIILGVLRQASASVAAAITQQRVADLARSAAARIEAGLDSPGTLNGPVRAGAFPAAPAGYTLDIGTERSGFPGLTLLTVRAARPDLQGAPSYTVRQMVRLPSDRPSARAPRRRRKGPGHRRGFTLIEVLIALGLLLVLTAAVSVFLRDLEDRRRFLTERSTDAQTAALLFDSLDRELLGTFVAGRSGPGVAGDTSRLTVLTRGVMPAAAGASDVQRSEYRWDPAAASLAARRTDAAGPAAGDMELLSTRVAKARFRYHDGVAWLDAFDSRSAGRLPVAIEVSLWFGTPGTAVSEDAPPDRQRTIAVADPAADPGAGSAGRSSPSAGAREALP